MLKVILKKTLFFLFLLFFSCSECQQQSKIRALNWLNKAYGHRTSLRNEDLFAYALRLETGIRGRDDVVDRNSFYPILEVGSIDIRNNCVSLLQCALMYKGYYVGPISGKFDRNTASAVMEFKKDALGGRVITNSQVTPLFLLAIVGRGEYVRSADGDENMRRIQQYLNRNYSRRCSIIPTNGKYSHRTHFNLIRALQVEVDCEKIDKRFGDETTEACPTLYPGMKGRLVYILQSALYANGFRARVSGVYDTNTVAAVRQFQGYVGLPKTGVANMRTIKALLCSTGDTGRPALACDCWLRLSSDDARALYAAGYRYVGRYLTGTIKGYKGRRVPKYVNRQEFYDISAAGLRLFPIFQEEDGHDVKSFSAAQGRKDAVIAIAAARKLELPKRTVIYFSVDCDPSEEQISKRIVPYFSEVSRIVRSAGYRVGVYGDRLVCTSVSNYGYATFSFVGDETPMYYGNIAQRLPKNWAFDQFYELKGKKQFQYAGGKFNLDKVSFSGRDIGVISPRFSLKRK